MRRLLAVAVAVALIAGPVLPARAADPTIATAAGQARALQLLGTPCLPLPRTVAQVLPSASPEPADDAADAAASPSPTPSPALSPGAGVPRPIILNGPGVLVPPPLPSTSPQVTPPPLPSPTPSPAGSGGPIYLVPATPPTATPTPAPPPTAGPIRGVRASPTPSAAPKPGETLGPNDYAILGDTLTGNRTPGQPFDLDGHVNIIYQDGILVGDHAHYDGTRYIDVTGHTYIQNHAGDSTLTADSIRFDTITQHAQLINGRGVTSQGVDRGRLHFNAQHMETRPDGFTHGTHASMTTCENPHGGYHVEAKTLDITPGDKAIARSVTIFLGPLAIFFLPLLIIPLRREQIPGVRKTGFLPLIGYSDAEGFYVKARIGFGTSNQYYGYYRVEYYTKIGYGLGYVASFRRKDGKRSIDLDVFRLHNRIANSDQWNGDFRDQEVISPALRGVASFTYQADYGPLISLPANESLALGLTKTSGKDSQNYTFSKQSTGQQNTTDNYGISDTYAFSPKLTNAFTSSYTNNINSFSGITGVNSTLHFNDDLHYSGRTTDYDLTIDRYNASTPSGVDKLPELLIRPHGSLFPHLLGGIPNSATFTIGEYSDPIAALATGRAEAQLNFGPALYHLPIGDFSSSLNIRQDAYGTGDMKAQVEQQDTLTTPIGNHFDNILSYSNQHVNGLGNEPFTFDTIGGAYKNLQEVFKMYNGSVYAFSLQTGTAFNRMAQPVAYQLLVRPTPLSSVALTGNFTPGSGNGFDRTNLQIVAPLGRGSDIQFATYIDWKNHMRLESKNIYFRQVIGDCYEVRVSYNEDLKTVAVTLDILAFPSQGLNFGFGAQNSSVIPQSFATSQFFGQ
ncbi:MAG TPA: hypothetical protein VIJ64_08120 [Candidatus Lustribacter sp.]